MYSIRNSSQRVHEISELVALPWTKAFSKRCWDVDERLKWVFYMLHFHERFQD